LPDPGQKHLAVPGAFKKPRSAGTLQTNAGDQRAGLIVSVGGCAPTVFAQPGPGPAGASSGCWLRFRPQTPDGPWARQPTPHASAPSFRRRRDVLVRRRPECFLNFQPSRRSQRSIVEVRKGRSRPAPNSASVASGCSDRSWCRRCLRSPVSSVLRPHK